MADTIRDVVIRIGLQQVNNQLKAPDFSSFKSALAEINNRISEANANMRSMATAAAEAAATAADAAEAASQISTNTQAATVHVVEIRKELEGAAEAAKKVQDAFFAAVNTMTSTSAADEIDEWVDSIDQWVESLGEALEIEKEIIKATEEQEKRTKALHAFQDTQLKSLADGSLKGAEGVRQIGDGLFAVTRGLTFLGGEGNKELEEFVKQLAKVQGAFDMFRGAVDIYKGIIETTRALTAITTTWTTAQTAATAANTAYTTSTVSATAATNAFTASLARNPIGLVIVALTAAAAAAFAYALSVLSASKSMTEAEKQAAALAAQQDLLAKRLKISADLAEKLLLNRTNANLVQDERDRLDALTETLTIQEQLAKIEERRANNYGFTNREVLEERSTVDPMTTNQVAIQQAINAQEELQALNERSYEMEQRKLDLLKQQAGYRDDELDKARQNLQTIQDQLAAEKSKSEEMAIQLGQLTKGQQNQLQRLSDKAAGGKELSNKELERLSRLGGASVQDYVKQQYAERGQGLTDVLSPFTSQQQQRQKSLETQQSYMKDVVKELEEEVKQIAERNRKEMKEVAEEMKKFFEYVTEGNKELKEMAMRAQELRNGGGLGF